jgi:hypothetical protein
MHAIINVYVSHPHIGIDFGMWPGYFFPQVSSTHHDCHDKFFFLATRNCYGWGNVILNYDLEEYIKMWTINNYAIDGSQVKEMTITWEP